MKAKAIVWSACAVAAQGASLSAQIEPVWVTRFPVGSSLSAGLQGSFTTGEGITYLTGITGSSSNTDVLTVGVSTDGAQLWSQVFNGPQQNWHDQSRGLAVGPTGDVYVVGNVPGPGSYANVMQLRYSGAHGNQLGFIQHSSGPQTSEFGASIAVDAQGNTYIGGGTVGDGSDCLLLSFDEAGQLRWSKTWDGPAFAPYSQDHVQLVKMAPDANPVFMIHGVMNSLHPDYVIQKRDAGTGEIIWNMNWGVNGGDFPVDMVIDQQGDVYVTGTGINFNDMYSTIKVDGQSGQLIWQEYDFAGIDDAAAALAIDNKGGVYVTGRIDVDGNRSNFNDDFYSVKRDAGTGALLWSHLYGDPCKFCYDVPSDIAVDSAGNVFIIGVTSSSPYSGDTIMFVLDSATGLEVNRAIVENGTNESAGPGPLHFDAQENIYAAGRGYDVNTGANEITLMKFESFSGGVGCYADCDQSGALDFFDFLCFQNQFATGQAYADCDASGTLDFFDFLCFQNRFAAGCP